MKRLITLLPFLSFFCFAMLIAGCQKENQTAEVLTPNETVEATERSCVAGCQQCSIPDFCCCKIDLLDPANAQILFCGELPGCIGIDSCTVSAMGNCPEIRGILANANLNSLNPSFYCQKKGEAIRITNPGIQDIRIRITCGAPDSLGNVTSPSSTEVLIPGSESRTIFADTACEPEECS